MFLMEKGNFGFVEMKYSSLDTPESINLKKSIVDLFSLDFNKAEQVVFV